MVNYNEMGNNDHWKEEKGKVEEDMGEDRWNTGGESYHQEAEHRKRWREFVPLFWVELQPYNPTAWRARGNQPPI